MSKGRLNSVLIKSRRKRRTRGKHAKRRGSFALVVETTRRSGHAASRSVFSPSSSAMERVQPRKMAKRGTDREKEETGGQERVEIVKRRLWADRMKSAANALFISRVENGLVSGHWLESPPPPTIGKRAHYNSP